MTSKGRIVKERPRILWVGDAVAHTGFANVGHSVLQHLTKKYDVSMLGINYFGDPHSYAYPIYPAIIGGDQLGIKRLGKLLQRIKPHITCIINDPWVVRDYLSVLDTPVGTVDGNDIYTHKVAYMPIDGKNIQPGFVEPLNTLDRAIFYTQFAFDEARKSGFTGDAAIIPHGVDLTHFTRMGTKKARAKMKLPDDWFIVGCVNRNQPRKRLDLALEYFAEWAKDKPANVRFYYHGALNDLGWNLLQLAEYHGINDRIILTHPDITTAEGVSVETLNCVYNTFNVQVTTTIGEGWGLTQMEGMACGVPQIVPDWSALGEWAKDGAALVACTSTQANSGGLNTIGGIPDKQQFIQQLDLMYYDTEYRARIAQSGYALVTQPQFQWQNVAQQFDTIFSEVMQ